jgi:uncharacterized repeat protein (TIGR01451 family)
VPPTEQAVRAPVSRSGAGVALGDGDAVTLENTILSANTTTMNGGSPFSDNCNMAFASGDYNIADDSSCGLSGTHDRENTDPKLGALADNGGQTRTQAIATDSPAFDGADGNDCPAKVNHDQRDISRPQSAACDVGAFELQQAQTASSADLALTKTVSPGSVTVGKNVSFLLTANNAGPNDATNTRVTDTLPSGLTFVSANPSQGSCSGTSTVTCALGTVRSSGTASVTIVARVSAVGTFTNSADVTADPSDPNPSNNSASARVTGKPPAAQGRLSLQVSATRGCVRTTARINVRVTAPAGIRTVRVTIDGKVGVRSKRSKFIVYVKRGALRVGPNPVKVVVTDRRGRSATRRPTLTRCRVRRAPSFTG